MLTEKTYYVVLIIAILWTIPWKGVALWKAARNGQKTWFIALLLVNTLALLDILYILVFSKVDEPEQSKIINH